MADHFDSRCAGGADSCDLALIYERGGRLAAEIQSRRRLLELVHLNQSATAGALSASIAHELNQPLGAIRSNAEAAELILNSETPDFDLINQILADIRDDDRRASDIIVRLKGLAEEAERNRMAGVRSQ